MYSNSALLWHPNIRPVFYKHKQVAYCLCSVI